MRHLSIVNVIVLVFAAALGETEVFAKDDCQVPIESWQSRDAALQVAKERGWRVERLKIDDGCYELRGVDATGASFKAKLDPQTLQTVKYKQRGPERSRERRRGR